MARLIPLFPLELVLLPSVPLPLHIFEPRYKEMIAECLAEHRPFGIVRSIETGIADIGCTAEILEITKRYDDGRMDIQTIGRERFEVVELNQDRDFLQGEVILLEDEKDPAASDDIGRLLELHSEVAELSGAEAEPVPPEAAEARSQLSYELAAALPLDLDLKQSLLALRSEAQRVAVLIKLYEAVLPKLRQVEEARRKAGGNGRVHHDQP